MLSSRRAVGQATWVSRCQRMILRHGASGRKQKMQTSKSRRGSLMQQPLRRRLVAPLQLVLHRPYQPQTKQQQQQ